MNVLTSSDNAVGAELTTHPDVDVVSFTGSTPVGRQIMAAASATVKRVFLELGGKSAFVLLDDGDAALAAMFCSYATISHSGQGCAITSRLVVPQRPLRRGRRNGARRRWPGWPTATRPTPPT